MVQGLEVILEKIMSNDVLIWDMYPVYNIWCANNMPTSRKCFFLDIN